MLCCYVYRGALRIASWRLLFGVCRVCCFVVCSYGGIGAEGFSCVGLCGFRRFDLVSVGCAA